MGASRDKQGGRRQLAALFLLSTKHATKHAAKGTADFTDLLQIKGVLAHADCQYF